MPPEATNTPAAAPDNSIQELAFLQSAGEDISDLRADLESMLGRAPDAEPAASAPVETRPMRGDDRLPFREDGSIIEPQPAADKASPAPVTQEKALDPYAPEGTKPQADEAGEVEPGEVTIDSEGKLRDAKTGKYVPHSAMHAERVRRKELEAELNKKNEDWARANERLAVLQEIVNGQQEQAKKAEAPAAPEADVDIDPDVDIFGWAKQQKARIEASKKEIADLKAQTERQRTETTIQTKYRQDVTSFAAKNADFFDGYKFIADMRTRELKALGFEDERQIANQLAAEERVLVQQELARGGSPAARLYALAKAKGYTGPAPAAAPTPPPVAPVQATPAAAPQQQMQPNQQAVEQVQRIQNGVNASATLSGAGGASGEGVTVQQLAEMPDDQFDALVAKMGRKRFEQMLGGR